MDYARDLLVRHNVVGTHAAELLTGCRFAGSAGGQKLQYRRHLLVDLVNASVEPLHLALYLCLDLVDEGLKARLLVPRGVGYCRWRC